jgi:DHA2 family methylenomycin A resistance protein-like MFS transporter
MMSTVDKCRAGIAAGVLNASRQSGSAFGVATFGALMSSARTTGQGVLMAISLAIGLSLAAAACWRATSRPDTGGAKSPDVRRDDAKTE